MRSEFFVLACVVLLAGCLQDSNPVATQKNAVVIESSQIDDATIQTGDTTGTPAATTETTPAETATTEGDKPAEPKWQALFDGETLANWKSTEFGGEGEVEVKDGQIKLNQGSDMSGITYTGKEFPKTNYEISVEAMRVDGTDFFAGLTFPVEDSYASFIPGGWGGGVVGISSIDGRDASDNATTTFQSFDKGKWYTLRVRVTKPKIEAWINDKQVVDEVITGHKISTRGEMELAKPFGISTWSTTGALKSIKLRKLTDEEIAAAEKSAAEAK